MKVQLNVNGFEYEASYTDREVNNIYLPLLKDITKKSRENKGNRYIVFLAAPPGTGKSTLSLLLEKLSREDDNLENLQALSLDGFHHFNDYLKSNYMEIDGKKELLYRRKGAPETFDLENIKTYLKKLSENKKVKWPIYDRQLHNPVMDVIDINSKIILIEGNWLLLDEEGWRDIKEFADYSIFIEAKKETIKNRLISRKVRGGYSQEDAENFYLNSDGPNVDRVLNHRMESDLLLEMLETCENKIK
ncbi:nucleoside/nucleotide kinase family protein [uncultured Ilyobacter sp.]|uniref:nucleoside/nucleotide kinase family protein n=1 Tax=uncultured Ilyobacter sp. TaxID=544433 RepID=UPI0029C6A0C5|nr:nucleoside/nucleotide kinase family protein [uncultured Ilyobacter sp.]